MEVSQNSRFAQMAIKTHLANKIVRKWVGNPIPLTLANINSYLENGRVVEEILPYRFALIPEENHYRPSVLCRMILEAGGTVYPVEDVPTEFAINVLNDVSFVVDPTLNYELPPDTYSSRFIYDAITRKRNKLPPPDIQKYRLTPSKYEDYDAMKVLRREVKWSDLRLAASLPGEPVFAKNVANFDKIEANQRIPPTSSPTKTVVIPRASCPPPKRHLFPQEDEVCAMPPPKNQKFPSSSCISSQGASSNLEIQKPQTPKKDTRETGCTLALLSPPDSNKGGDGDDERSEGEEEQMQQGNQNMDKSKTPPPVEAKADIVDELSDSELIQDLMGETISSAVVISSSTNCTTSPLPNPDSAGTVNNEPKSAPRPHEAKEKKGCEDEGESTEIEDGSGNRALSPVRRLVNRSIPTISLVPIAVAGPSGKIPKSRPKRTQTVKSNHGGGESSEVEDVFYSEDEGIHNSLPKHRVCRKNWFKYFTFEEDKKLLDMIIGARAGAYTGGNFLWKQLAKSKDFEGKRSYHSLKERFRRRLLRDLKDKKLRAKYNVDDKEIRELLQDVKKAKYKSHSNMCPDFNFS